MADGVRYIKISKIDKNGINQTNTLQSLNQITIPYTSGDIVYTVINIIEKFIFISSIKIRQSITQTRDKRFKSI